MKKKLFVLFLSVLLLTGCVSKASVLEDNTNEYSFPEVKIEESLDIKEENEPITQEVIEEKPLIEEELKDDKWELSSRPNDFQIPDYLGEPFVYINENKPFFTKDEIVNESYEYYSPLDDLGRSGYAMCCCGSDLFPDKERGDISMVYPSGWKQGKYDFLSTETYDGYLYNRCHLIAYCLTGIDGSSEENIPLLERNLFTGTHYLNIEGMWAVEETVYYYLKDNPANHVMYRVTPIYEGNDLLCKGVLMESYSVEDEGKGCQFCVFCFNVQPGVKINYRTGENNEE